MAMAAARSITCFILLAHVHGQEYGRGISKSTWAASNPQTCYDWFVKYMPVASAGGCTDNQCTCAYQARVQLEPSSSDSVDTMNFGVHAINCTYHPYGSMSIADWEDIFASKTQKFTQLDAFMDYNLGLWTNDLDDYTEAFDADGVAYLPLTWTYGGKQYYSAITNPCGYVMIEFISDTQTRLSSSAFTTSEDRMVFMDYNPPASGDYLSALKISRAVSDLDAVHSFYTDIMGATKIYASEASDGARLAVYKLPAPASVHLQFWEGRATSGNYTVKDFEDYQNSVHDKYMISPVCGFDQWMDNHYAWDPNNSSEGSSLNEFADMFDEAGIHYHWWVIPGDIYQIYAVDPTGWGVQLNAWLESIPTFEVPEYSAACSSNDGCTGQGICSSAGWKDLVEGYPQGYRA